MLGPERQAKPQLGARPRGRNWGREWADSENESWCVRKRGRNVRIQTLPPQGEVLAVGVDVTAHGKTGLIEPNNGRCSGDIQGATSTHALYTFL